MLTPSPAILRAALHRTSVGPPTSFAQVEAAGLTYSYVLAQAALLQAMEDSLDPLASMIASLKGDVAATGSDTLRITDIDGIGFGRRFTAMASESDTITASPLVLGYSEVTVAQQGLAHEETYQNQILGAVAGMSLEDLMAKVPESWLASLRYSACVTAAGITTAIGSAAAYLSVDDYLDVVTAHLETPGAGTRGAPGVALDPAQLSKLLASFRAEPAFQASLEGFTSLQGFKSGQSFVNFAGLGANVHITDDITQSGGAYQGFAISPGAIGWARASTDRIRPSGMGRALYMPEYGLFIEEIGKGEFGKSRYEARTWFGTGLGSSSVFFQRRLISKV